MRPIARANTRRRPRPANGRTRVEALHKELIEHIAESDDTLLQKFFDEGSLSEDVMRTGIHPAVQKQAFIPLFCTAGGDQRGRGAAARFHRAVRLLAGRPRDGRRDRRGRAALPGQPDRQGSGGLCVQDAHRPAERRPLDLPGLFRRRAHRHGSVQQRPPRERAHRPALPPQRQGAHAGRRAYGRGHRRGGETPGHAHRQHAVRCAATASCCPRSIIRSPTPRRR